MKRRNVFKVTVFVGLAILSAVGIQILRRPLTQVTQTSPLSNLAPSPQQPPSVQKPSPAQTQQQIGTTTAPAQPALLLATPPPALEAARGISKEAKKILNHFASRHNRALLSETDRRAMKYSESQINEIADYLKVPPSTVNHESAMLHQTAIDFLLAAHADNPEPVRARVMEIVLDARTSNASLPKSDREILAKDKAELLYHFTAIDPAIASSVQKASLDPVTSSIYQRVRREHQRNWLFSQAEVEAYKRK